MTRRSGWARACALGLVTLVAVASLSGCGGNDTSAAGDFNPCDLLDATEIANAVGSNLVVNLGSDDAAKCTLVPTEDGKAAIDVNYLQWRDLPDAWDQIGVEGLAYTSPKIGDAARLVVQQRPKMLGVTGLVEADGKVYVVNALQPAPYSLARLRSAVKLVMTQLAAGVVNTASPSITDPSD